jgi:hypothetical protein
MMRQGLKRGRLWFWKNKWIILIFIVIFVIIVLFILYGSDIDNNTTNVLMAFGSMLSAFFMFLAFRETRKSNEIKLKEDEFQDLKEKVHDAEITSTERIFNEKIIKELSSTLNYSDSELQKLTYSNFIYPFHGLFTQIFNNTNYKKCIESFSGTNRYQLSTVNIEDTKKLTGTFETINKAIALLMKNYFRLFFLYEEINISSILEERKKYLFNKLNSITDEYRYFFIDEIDKSDASFNINQFDSTKFLKAFETFQIDETNRIAIKSYSSFHSISMLVNYLKFRNRYF